LAAVGCAAVGGAGSAARCSRPLNEHLKPSGSRLGVRVSSRKGGHRAAPDAMVSRPCNLHCKRSRPLQQHLDRTLLTMPMCMLSIARRLSAGRAGENMVAACSLSTPRLAVITTASACSTCRAAGGGGDGSSSCVFAGGCWCGARTCQQLLHLQTPGARARQLVPGAWRGGSWSLGACRGGGWSPGPCIGGSWPQDPA
jgi:hypothetical protein